VTLDDLTKLGARSAATALDPFDPDDERDEERGREDR
jgi:hypothetical protein